MADSENRNEQIIAGAMMAASSQHASSNLASFAGWMIGGFGAAIALLVSNLTDVTQFVELSRIRFATGLFLVAVVLHVFQRWMAAIGAGGYAATKDGAAIGTSAVQPGAELDWLEVNRVVEAATYFPTRWLLRRKLRRELSGSYSAGGATLYKLAQWQALLVIMQMSLCVGAAGVIAQGLHV